MNKALKEAIFRQKVRRMHRVAVKRVLTEQEHNLYTTFIQPFKDVVDAVGLTGQDILNSVKLNLDLLFTISPKKMDEALKGFDERKAKIEEKWGPIMERTQSALANADADLMAMVFAPHVFLATTALQKGYEASGNLGKALGDAGFKVPFAAAILGYTPDETPARDTAAKAKSGEKEKGILGKMMSLFYVENTWREGDLILEKEEEKKKTDKPSPPPLDKALEDYLEISGMKDKFAADADEMLDSTLKSLEGEDSPLADGVVQLAVTKKISEVSNMEDFENIFNMARDENLDLKETGIEDFKKEIDDGVAKLMQSDDFKREVAGVAAKSKEDDKKGETPGEGKAPPAEEKVEESSLIEAEIETPEGSTPEGESAEEEVPEVPEDKLRKAAENVIFNNAAQNMRSKAAEAVPKMQEQLEGYLEKVSPPPGTLEVIKTDARGAEINKLVSDFKKKISG